MECLRVLGGGPLYGRLRIQGSKNAALPMIAAAVLHEGRTVLHNCPRIADVFYMVEILRSLGAVTRWEDHSLYLDCTYINYGEIPRVYGDKMRSSIIYAGALLGRIGKCVAPHPGGCVIGERPIDLHLMALEKLGAEIVEKEDTLYARCDDLKGNTIEFPKRSVGATQQAMLAAVRADGITHLYHCAREPEIQHLADFLNYRGADIEGAGGNHMVIRGVKKLTDVEYEVPADRIVAGTYMCACAITRGHITLEKVPLEEMDAFLDAYCKMGGQYKGNSGKLIASGRWVGENIPYIQTESYPGFPTDLQSPLMAVLATISGRSHLRETIFEDRLKTVTELRKMGASIKTHKGDAWIEGVPRLHGATVRASELRGGVALVIAALAAQGETVIENSHFIHRGYEHICEDIKALGGVISKDTGNNVDEQDKAIYI